VFGIYTNSIEMFNGTLQICCWIFLGPWLSLFPLPICFLVALSMANVSWWQNYFFCKVGFTIESSLATLSMMPWFSWFSHTSSDTLWCLRNILKTHKAWTWTLIWSSSRRGHVQRLYNQKLSNETHWISYHSMFLEGSRN